MPRDSDGTYWDLEYPVRTLDQRIEMRGELSALRHDPHVVHVGVGEGGLRSAPGGRVVVRVRFHVAYSGPQDPSLHEIERDREVRPLMEEAPPPTNPEEGFRHLGDYSYGRRTEENANLTDAIRNSILSRALGSPEGRSRLAQSMIAPLRTRMDYNSIARRTFIVDQLPEGALPVYSQDLNVSSLIGNLRDGIARSSIVPERILMNEADFQDIRRWGAQDLAEVLPLPEWCMVGAFVEHYETGGARRVGRIADITDRGVFIEPWTPGVLTNTVFYRDGQTPFTDAWNLCEKPCLQVTVMKLRSRYDRDDLLEIQP